MTASFQFQSDRPIDVICMGRVAVDLYSEQIGATLEDTQTFRKYLGGCAGNIAVGTARLGLRSAMFSCVGTDAMGQFLKRELLKEQVDIQFLRESSQHLTGLVLLGVNPPDHFPLIFYRNQCADMQLKPTDLSAQDLAQAKTLLVTGTCLSTESMRDTTKTMIAMAKSVNTTVIFDIDYRPVLWRLTAEGDGETRYLPSAEVSAHYQAVLGSCDLIVGTEEEICIAGNTSSVHDALINIRALTSAPIVMKRGAQGSVVYFDRLDQPLFTATQKVEVLNVLGAGDAFMSGLLRGLLRGESWETSTHYANQCGAIVVTRHGCAPAMPSFDEVTHA